VGAGVALIGPCNADRFSRGALHSFAKLFDLRALLLIGRRHRQRNQMAQRIDSHVYLAAPTPLVAVVAGAWTALAAALQRAPVQDDRARLARAGITDTDDRAHVIDHGLEAARVVPASELLIHHLPGRQIVRQQPPRRTRTGQPAQGVEGFAQAV